MKEIALKSLPHGSSGYISRCLSPMKDDVYRLLEMGLCRGAEFTVLNNAPVFGAIELALKGSRLCIGNDLASEFMAVLKGRTK